jgi:2-oxoglutarate ferredoxin oxidoreductase subunit gamma
VIPVQAAIDSLENVISAHYKKLIPMNAKAIEAGAAHVA